MHPSIRSVSASICVHLRFQLNEEAEGLTVEAQNRGLTATHIYGKLGA
jgi:hypothetical protein